jgi:glutamine synthetase
MPNDVFEPHPLVRLLEKPAADFTCSDLVQAMEQLELRQLNLRYVGGDGRLKTLAFAINSREHLIQVLTQGERVDGSSVFPGTETQASDVYIVPRHRTAFVNPFGERPSLDLLCSFYDEDGSPLPYAREQIVRRAAEVLRQETGMALEAFGELEYYLVDEVDPIFRWRRSTAIRSRRLLEGPARARGGPGSSLRDGHPAEVRPRRGRQHPRGRAAVGAARDRVLAAPLEQAADALSWPSGWCVRLPTRTAWR